jgi:hypothetical protein
MLGRSPGHAIASSDLHTRQRFLGEGGCPEGALPRSGIYRGEGTMGPSLTVVRSVVYSLVEERVDWETGSAEREMPPHEPLLDVGWSVIEKVECF